MSDPMQDLRYALRMYGKHPGFVVITIVTLALGIGASVAIFSVVNAVLLKPVPFPAPDRLVMFTQSTPQGLAPGGSPAKFNFWQQDATALEDVAAYYFGTMNLTDGQDPEQVHVGHVSHGFFGLFGGAPVAGRTFTADEDRPGGSPVTVLSHAFWQRRFGGRADVVGRSVSLNGQPHRIVGVLGPGFDTEALHSPFGIADAAALWTPLQIDATVNSHGNSLLVAGRLRPGVTVAAADARLDRMARDFRERYPGALRPAEGFRVRLLQDIVVNDVQRPLVILLAAVGFVLLLACANVANLLLVRGIARHREIGVRSALGASRGRIVRQLLTESVMLSCVGGALGLGLGLVLVRILVTASPILIPGIGGEAAAIVLDWPTVAFTVGVSVLTGIVFGLLPALHSGQAALIGDAGTRPATSTAAQSRLRGALVVSEVALALLLVLGAALLIRTFVALRSVNPGFDPQQVLTLRMSLTDPRFSTTAAVDGLVREGVRRMNALPGVTAAAATCCLPLENDLGLRFVVDGRPLDGSYHGMAGWRIASPGYFDVFRIPLVRGRTLTDDDRTGAPGVVVINQTMARQFWPGADPIGQRLIIGRGIGPEFAEPPREIVGIVADVLDGNLRLAPRPIMYVPIAQVTDGVTALNNRFLPLAWILRTASEPSPMAASVERELRQASGLPVANIRTMDEVLARSTAESSFIMMVLGIFGVAASVLAGVGIYGLVAHAVQQRTKELGIRVALGADPTGLRNMVVWQGTRLALVGITIGLVAGAALTRFLAGVLFGVKPLDPIVFVVAPVLLSGIAAVAAWVPARRAARTDAMSVLRDY